MLLDTETEVSGLKKGRTVEGERVGHQFTMILTTTSSTLDRGVVSTTAALSSGCKHPESSREGVSVGARVPGVIGCR